MAIQYSIALRAQFREAGLHEGLISHLDKLTASWRPGDRVNEATTRLRSSHGAEILLRRAQTRRNESPNLIVSRRYFRNVESDLVRLANPQNRIDIELCMRVQYSEPAFTVTIPCEVVRICSALGASVDLDAYRVLGERVDEEPEYESPTVAVGTKGLSFAAGSVGQVAYVPGAVVTRREELVGGYFGQHLASLSADLGPYERGIRVLGALHEVTLWCRSRGGWGRPNAVITASQVQALARFNASIELQVSYD